MADRLETHRPEMPDPWTVLLPARAYLRSLRDQTLTARQAAFEDSLDHLDAVAAGDDSGLRDMALLGVIGDGLQILEDLGYFATACASPLAGLVSFLTATIYNDRTPNNFYSSFKNRSPEELKVLAGLWMLESENSDPLPIHVVAHVGHHLSEEKLAAIREAEDATIKRLRLALLNLAGTWEDFRRFFHAFKHGALAVNREDWDVVGAQGKELSPAISVWLRRADASSFGETDLPWRQVAREILQAGHVGLEVTRYMVETRLAHLDIFEFDDDGAVVALRPPPSMWRFWFHEEDVSEQSRALLAGVDL